MNEDISISSSRTYVVGIYDLGAPNNVRFEKVTLPELNGNTSKHAKQYYFLQHIDQIEGTRLLMCMPIEDFRLLGSNEVVSEIAPEEKRKDVAFDSDTQAILNMLEAWNAKQKYPMESSTAAMRSLLDQFEFERDLNKQLTEILKSISDSLEAAVNIKGSLIKKFVIENTIINKNVLNR